MGKNLSVPWAGQLQGIFLWGFFRARCLAYLENNKKLLPSPVGMERHDDFYGLGSPLHALPSEEAL